MLIISQYIIGQRYYFNVFPRNESPETTIKTREEITNEKLTTSKMFGRVNKVISMGKSTPTASIAENKRYRFFSDADRPFFLSLCASNNFGIRSLFKYSPNFDKNTSLNEESSKPDGFTVWASDIILS